jgi:hypothetical protein
MPIGNKVILGILAAVMASMIFTISSSNTTRVFAQANPANPSSTASPPNQGTSNATSSSSSSSMPGMKMSSAAPGTANKTTIVRDSQTILLEGKTIPAKDFIHLYDSTPYMIMNGSIVMKVPCDASSKPAVNVLIGSAPNVKPVQPEVIKELSKAGSMCMYHVDVGSKFPEQLISGNFQTDIAIQNPSNSTITFPPTSTFVIGVNEIMPGVPG